MRIPSLAHGLGLVALACLAAGQAIAQDAGTILQTALARYEERVRGIDDYTVTYAFMGRSFSTYLRKQMVDGHPVFVPADGDAESTDRWDPYREFPKLAARAANVGTESIDGVEAHGLRVDDFDGLDVAAPPQVQGEFRPRTLTIWIDTGEYLVRRMDIDGVVVMQGEERPVEMTALMQDYRTVEGMPHPFRTAIRVDGAMAGGDTSDEDLAEAREKLAELDRQMAQMPESQRKMMERMMGSQLEQLRKMVQSGALEIELVVSDLRVNSGPPKND